ncbi:MAG: hypothetical protein GX803_01710 [Lentisphaerae bacterium]|nr:hypothetical protein [Lentisphaerota bacterium]
MLKTIQRCCLAATMVLLTIQSVHAEPYQHPDTGIEFPDRLGGLRKGPGAADYEAQNPGLGVSVRYEGPWEKADVYLYTLGLSTVPSNLQDPVLKDHFQETIREVAHFAENGLYEDFNIISTGEAAWQPGSTIPVSLHASFAFSQEGIELLSHLYLRGFQNHFLKVRFTYLKEANVFAGASLHTFLAELGKILDNLEDD